MLKSEATTSVRFFVCGLDEERSSQKER